MIQSNILTIILKSLMIITTIIYTLMNISFIKNNDNEIDRIFDENPKNIDKDEDKVKYKFSKLRLLSKIIYDEQKKTTINKKYLNYIIISIIVIIIILFLNNKDIIENTLLYFTFISYLIHRNENIKKSKKLSYILLLFIITMCSYSIYKIISPIL